MSNQLPVYIQIHDQLKNEIEQGIWKVGDRLPSERELAVKFNVSRMTLRQAIQNLADEGILERKIGSGTYVAREKYKKKCLVQQVLQKLWNRKIEYRLVGQSLIS